MPKKPLLRLLPTLLSPHSLSLPPGGLGFVHAFDRLTQLDFSRAVSLGRLEEHYADSVPPGGTTTPFIEYIMIRMIHIFHGTIKW